MLIYILYLAGMVVGVTPLIGIIVAYVNKGSGAEWVQSHYRFQIRTFWIGLLIAVIGLVTSFIMIGFLVLLAYVIWWIVRCVVGLKYLSRREAHPNPGSWTW
ncbi:DUF4870 family protein [Lacibacterium aquatile]|uniref:DUF4870 family protein n=1 Tax=Lacibacterium aquatile TaxID=1168082 RepID=A0ABW5DK63_9PROT